MKDFYRGKRVFITGDTGFKGAILSYILMLYGADVYGYALEPPTRDNVYDILKVESGINHTKGDVRDYDRLIKVIEEASPEIVFHLAAQPIVRESYNNPRYTYDTNVMGTVNLLDCIRMSHTVQSVVNVTTDKVYENSEAGVPFTEDMRLNGYDPYSNSKSCSELVTDSYSKSFLRDNGIAVSTARAGNVIGGGDFAKDRIIPDCVRYAVAGESIIVRNPHSIRPYQHVLEPLYAYMLIAMKQYDNKNLQGNYNVGPDDNGCVTTGELADIFCNKWGDGMNWIDKYDGGPYESSFLKLDCSKIKNMLGWNPSWDIDTAVDKSVQWYKAYYNGDNVARVMDEQIGELFNV